MLIQDQTSRMNFPTKKYITNALHAAIWLPVQMRACVVKNLHIAAWRSF